MIREKIQSRRARVGILGLGYVGLPLAVEFAKAGFPTVGFELDTRKVKSLLAGHSYIEDVPSRDIEELTDKGILTATTDFSKLRTVDAVIICVPTPLNKTKDPDVSYIGSAAEKIAQTLHKDQLIILESTTYPGTTRDFMLPILEKTGLKIGTDFFVAFSPERIDPGNKQFHLTNTPKVVGGITPKCQELACLLYGQVIQKIIPVSSAESAELVKLLENTFRSINIGLVNEIALICDKLNLNVWEVIEAASSKPYGFMPFYPGPGLGGHCIPIDPHYLSWKMKSLNFSARFIELAGEINSHMPEFVVEKIARILNQRKRAVNGSKILVLGVAYKANVSDMRESPALDIIELLHKDGASVTYHDPWVPHLNLGHLKLTSKPLSKTLLKSADLVVITTAHSKFQPSEIVKHSRLVFDTRNLTRGLKASHIIRL